MHPAAPHTPPVALTAADFGLSAAQLHAINAFVQDRYQQFVAQGAIGRFPEVQVRLEFAPRYGRSVYVTMGTETAEFEVERWSQLRSHSREMQT